ncbi:hypothetical protein [Amycolatopsis lurida]|uniref:hypothetical protein n=1 Tax=Amycolatopsis lurida TaxID=31959 RepID=UPI0013011541|nr:hypothetical protein [Amycolatopsis lurida]
MVDSQVSADARQGPAEVVKVNGLVDLLRREAAAAHLYVVPAEDVADGSPLDAELDTEFVHRRACHVAGDQLLDLLGAELPDTARSAALDRRQLG